MSSAISPCPILQFLDNLGRPCAGGSLLTQVGGVNAPTYSDSALTDPLPNPIPLNSRGECSVADGHSTQVFLSPATVYTFTLRDSGGNLLWTATYVTSDQVTRAEIGSLLYQRTAAEIAAAVVPTDLSYPPLNPYRYGANGAGGAEDDAAVNAAAAVLQAIPNGVVRWLNGMQVPGYVRTPAEIGASVMPVRWDRPELDIIRYGADPTGAADSTAAINAAIAVARKKAAITQPGLTLNAAVRIPHGWFVVGSAGAYVEMTGGKSVFFVGEGRDVSCIVNGSADHPAIKINGTSMYYGGFKDIGFFFSAAGTAGQCAIYMHDCIEWTMESCGIWNFPQLPYDGVQLDFCQQFEVSNTIVQGTTNHGWHLKDGIHGHFSQCKGEDCGVADWSLDHCERYRFTACAATYGVGAATTGWLLKSTDPLNNPNYRCTFVNCSGEANTGHNWWIQDAHDCHWVDCVGSLQKQVVPADTHAGWRLESNFVNWCTFTACVAEFNNGNGFELIDAGATGAPQHITFYNCSMGTAAGNGAGGAGYGISMDGTVAHIRIVGGMMYNNVSGPIGWGSIANAGANNILIRDVLGYQTTDQGVAVIPIGQNNVQQAFFCNLRPFDLSYIQISAASSFSASGVANVWITDPGIANTFQINVNANVSGSPFKISWRVSATNT